VNNYLGQLGLSAQERRIVVGIFLVVFIVLNYLFVWPSFGQWGSLDKERLKMLGSISDYNRVIQQDIATNGWRKQIELLTQQEGASVMEHPVDAQVQLQNTIRAQERKTGVYIESANPGSVKTNEFFEEQSTSITLECQEPQLVGFLYHMGMDPAMIRVAMLNLKPADNNRYRLKATMTLQANYAKKPASAVNELAAEKHVPGGRPPGSPGSKPATPAVAKPPGVPAPTDARAARRSPDGQFVPKSGRQPPAGKNPPVPGRPVPPGRNVPGQKAAD
jgi:Tfp pilus assembly protein PilO